jgi:hypothetical protein
MFKKLVRNENIRPEVAALAARGNVTLAEWKEFRGNSWEFEALYCKLDDEAFAYAGEHALGNSWFERTRPWKSYNELLMGQLAPELLRRFNERLEADRRQTAEYEAVVALAENPPAPTQALIELMKGVKR